MTDPMDAALDELFGPPGAGDTEVAPKYDDPSNIESALFVWDIETGPQSKAKVKRYYTPPEPPGEFDPESVKVGNLGPEKAEAKIEAAREKHQQLIEDYESIEAAAWDEFYDRCALNPATGRILTSQYLFVDQHDTVLVHHEGWKESDEAEFRILDCLWERVDHVRRSSGMILGYNLAQFDVPFAIQRSYALGVKVPSGLFWKHRHLADFFVDLYDIWRCGRRDKFTDAVGFKLSDVAGFLGLESKTLAHGGEFWKLYKNTKTRVKALEYAHKDVQIEAQLARKMGVIL